MGNWDGFLDILDGIVEAPPLFYRAQTTDLLVIGEPIGVPLYLIFDLLSNTPAGHPLFLNQEFNLALQALLNAWGAWLQGVGNGSNDTLNAGLNGWFSADGRAYLEAGLGRLTFEQTFAPDAPGGGVPFYNSWDSFFTRQFLPGVRPIQPGFVVNACESTVFRTARKVQVNDTFWMKEQNYSIHDILGTLIHTRILWLLYSKTSSQVHLLIKRSLVLRTITAGTAPSQATS